MKKIDRNFSIILNLYLVYSCVYIFKYCYCTIKEYKRKEKERGY